MRFKNKFLQFFFEPRQDNDWIIFFRISIGTMVLLHFLSVWRDFDMLYGREAIIPVDILSVYTPDFVITFDELIRFIASLGLSQQTSIEIYKYLYLFLSFLLVIGLFPRIAAFLLLFLQIGLSKGAPLYAYGVDYFTSMSLFYLILVPSDFKYSVHGFFKPVVTNFNLRPFHRLFQLHLSIAYFFSGFDKVLGFNWWNGESIWKAFHLPFVNQDFQINLSWLAEFPAILIFLGWATVLLEMLYPLFIWIRKTRKLWLFLIIGMHLGIALILNLYFFAAVMIIWNLTAFYFDPKHHISYMK